MNRVWAEQQESSRVDQHEDWRDFAATRGSRLPVFSTLTPPTSVEFPPLTGGREAWETRQRCLREGQENAQLDVLTRQLIARKN